MPTPRPARAAKPAKGHSKPAPAAQVIEELRPGQSIELLKELHILTREGKLNQDTRRKLKQVYHLYQFIEPLLKDVAAHKAGFTLADHGAGKSYLGFILYDLFFNVAHAGEPMEGHVYGIETRAELVDKSRSLAARLGFARMSFLNLTVQEATTSAELPPTVDIVTALHACDTATDDAIAFGLAKQARQWCWCLAARLKWPVFSRKAGPCRSPKPRWPSSGGTRCTRANSAARSPTCCAVCSSKPTATRSP